MHKSSTRSAYTFLLAILVASIVIVVDMILYHAFFYANKVESLSNLQEKELDAFLEMNKLLSGLATLTIGAIGTLAVNAYKSSGLHGCQLKRAVTCSLLSVISISMGYLNYDRIIRMLDNKLFNLHMPLIQWHARLQFLTFLASVVLFADFAYRALHKE